jgi:hypothetical protein
MYRAVFDEVDSDPPLVLPHIGAIISPQAPNRDRVLVCGGTGPQRISNYEKRLWILVIEPLAKRSVNSTTMIGVAASKYFKQALREEAGVSYGRWRLHPSDLTL